MRFLKTKKTDATTAPGDQSAPAETVCFDVSDLLHFLRHSPTVTGIQRVQMEAARAMLAQESLHANCVYYSTERNWRSLDRKTFCEVFDAYSRGIDGWDETLRAYLADTLEAPVHRFASGDILLMLGATWNMPGIFESLRQLRFDGVECVFYMHDLLPLTHSEYFEDGHVLDFGYWFFNCLQVASGLICNSEETREAVRQLSDFGGPIEVAELSIEPGGAAANETDVEAGDGYSSSQVLLQNLLEPDGYALMVGTLEPRKNHITAINAWSALAKQLGDACPKLVIVGKKGWKSEGITATMDAMNRHGKIVWVQGVNDNDLTVLYKNSLCGLYLSRGEGWGLPVSEGLAVGKPMICGKNSCAAAATQDLAIVVDECSERDVTDTLLDLFSNREKLEENRERVKSAASFKTWRQFGEEILELTKPMRTGQAKGVVRSVSVGRTYRFGHATKFAELDFECFGDSLLWGPGWHHAENWGVWSSQARAELRCSLPSDDSYDIYFKLSSPLKAAEIKLFRGETELLRKTVQGSTLLKVIVKPEPDEDYIAFTLETNAVTDMSKNQNNSDIRLLGFGLGEMRFVRSDDLAARLDALESFL